jgi:trigger factor
MQVSALKTDGLVHQYEVKVPAADIQRQVETKLKELGATVKIPGFRPGKVPAQVVLQRYGASVLSEAVEDTANNAVAKTMSEKSLRPAVQPKVEFSSTPDGIPATKDLVMKLEIEVIPEIPAVDFGKISLEKPITEPTDKEITDSLTRVANANRKPEEQPADYVAKNGDSVFIDFDGSVDGVRREGMAGEQFALELGSNRFIPGFEEQLVGVKKGDKRAVKVTFPTEYHSADLAGKAAVFDVTVHSVSQLKSPEINDELAKGLGFDDVAALKKAVSEQIGQNFDQVTRAIVRRRLMDKLADATTFQLPPTLAAQEFAALWEQIEAAKKADQLEEDDKKKTDAQLKKDYQDIAERRVRLGLLLSDIARKNKLEVGREDIRRAMFQEAQRYPGQEKAVIEYFSKNAQAREQLTAPLLEEKVIDFILSKIDVKEKKVSRDELQKLSEDA